MKEQFYKDILDKSPVGYAYHKVLIDENSMPVDFVFLEVNEAFSRLTGLKRQETIGRKVTEVLPGIEKRKPNWIKIYGELALSGAERDFEGYSNTFNAPYRAKAYCPEKGYFILIFVDASKEKSLEDEMAEFYEISPFEIYKFDRTGKIIGINSKAGRNSGYNRIELLDMNIMDFLVSKDSVKNFERQVFSGSDKKEYNWEYPYLTKEGHTRYGRCTIVRQEDGNFVGFTNDITDYYMSMQEEENIKQQYKKLFENLSSAAIIFDVKNDGKNAQDYIIADINKVGRKIENIRKKEVLGMNLKKFRPKVEEFGIIEKFCSVYETGKPIHFPPALYSDRKEKRYFENDIFKLNETQIVALYRDVTQFMEEHAELDENRKMLDSYLQKAPYGILIAGADGRYKDVNEEVQKMSGYSRAELLTMDVNSLQAPDTKIPGYKSFSMLKEKGAIEIEKDYIKKDGERRTWYLRAAKVNDDNYIGFFRDITAEKEVQRELEHSREEMRALIDHAGVGIGYFDAESRALLFNNIAANSTGATPEEIEGKTIDELFPEEDAKVYKERFEKALVSKKAKEYVDLDITPEGKRWYTSTYNRIYNSKKESLGVEVTVKEITEIKKAEEALRLSEERFRSMVEASGAIMLLIDPETAKIDHANHAACSFYGWSLKEMLQRTKHDLNIISKSEVDEIINSTVENGSARLNLKHKLRDGRIRDVIVDSTLVEINGRKQLFSIVFDDTERVEAEKRLNDRANRYRLLFEDAPLGYQSLDNEGRFIVVNDAWLQMFGYKKQDVIGKRFDEFLVPGDAKKFSGSFQSFKEKGNTTINFRMVKKDKSIITVNFTSRAADKGLGSFKNAHCHCILNDITDQLEAQKQLERNERRLQRSQKIAKSGSWEIEGNSDKIWASENAFAIYGLPEDTGYVSVDYAEQIIHEDDRKRAHEALINFRKGKSGYDLIFRIKPPNTGEIKYLRSVAEIEVDSDKKTQRVLGAIRDITEQVRLEEEKAKADVILRNQQKLESIGTLASGIAHEINNPINGILNYGQVISDSVDDGSEIKGFAEEIIHETNRVSVIVRNLLDFSRQNNQQHSYARLEDIVESTLSLIRTIFRHDNIELNISIAKNICKIKCRSQQIQQVLMNLLTNARDALNERYPGVDKNKKINLTCRQYTKDKRKWVSIVVEDFGKGMPEETKQRIFDPFFTTKKGNKGTGLGLSISYGIVKEHHGQITVESEPEKSTKFTLLLPCDNGWDLE